MAGLLTNIVTSPQLVSVVITCYNKERFIAEAIQSVLDQTYAYTEIIVIDDGSTDQSSKILQSFCAVKVVWQRNRGAANARNTGLRLSHGKFILFLDGDDRLLPNAIEDCVGYLQRHNNSGWVSGLCHTISEDGTRIESQVPTNDESLYAALLRSNIIWTPACAVFRRTTLYTTQPFDEQLTRAEDLDLYLRLCRTKMLSQIPVFVAEYRQVKGGKGHDYATCLPTYIKILRRHRRFTRSSDELKSSYRTGLANARRYYGLPLIEDTKKSFAQRLWKIFLNNLIVLGRSYPQSILLVLKRNKPTS